MYEFTVEVVPYLLSLQLSGFLAIFILVFRKHTRTNMLFVAINTLLSIWFLGYCFEILATTRNEMVFWLYVQFIGIEFIPVLFFIFTLSLANLEEKLFSRLYYPILLFLPSIWHYFLLITNESHHLFYSSLELNTEGGVPFPAFEYVRGVFFWSHAITTYAFIISSVLILLLAYTKKKSKIFQRQIQLTALSVLIILIGATIDIVRVFPEVEYLNATPVSFLIASFLFLIAIWKYQLLDVIPLAYSNIIENTNIGIIVTDSYNRILEINPRAIRIMFEKDYYPALIGKNLYTLIYSDKNLEYYYQGIHQIEESLSEISSNREKIKRFEFEILNPQRREREYLSVLVQGLQQKTQFIGFIYLIQNISSQKEVEKILRKNADFKSSLLRIISHDLKNQIMVIQGFTDVIRNQIADNSSEIIEFLDGIDVKTKEMQQIVSNVQKYVKTNLELERIQDFKAYDIKNELNNTISSFNPELVAKNLNLKIEWPEDDKIYSYVDARISSIFSNIFSNAIKFSPLNGNIIIKIVKREPERMWQFSIIDQGEGIPNELKKEIFKPFTIIGPKDKVGSGLGLAITREIIHNFKGDIWVEDADPKGANFSFTLPIFDIN